MTELSLGIIVTLCSIGVSTIVLIILYCACRSKNKLYDHTCVALLHPDEEKQIEAYKLKDKKQTVVHTSGVTVEHSEKEHFISGKSLELSKEKTRNSTTLPRDSRQRDMKSYNDHREGQNDAKSHAKTKPRKPYEVKVELREQEPLLENAPETLFRKNSGQHSEKCPLDDGKSTLRQSERGQSSRRSRNSGEPHYLRPKSFDEHKPTAKERREMFSRSHSDSVFKHYSKMDGEINSSRYLRPRSLDSKDGRALVDEHYVRPRDSQRLSYYYDTPKTTNKDSYYERPRSLDDNKTDRPTSRKEKVDSYYVSPRSSERERRKENKTLPTSMHPRSDERYTRDSTDMTSRKIEKDVQRAKLDLESYYSQYNSPKNEQKREHESQYVQPRRIDKQSYSYDIPRSFDKEEGRESYYVKPRTLDKDHARREHRHQCALDDRGAKIYSSTQNVYNSNVSHRDKVQRSRSADRESEKERGLKHTKRSASHYLTPSRLDEDEMEFGSKERGRRESRGTRKNEASIERDRSRERRESGFYRKEARDERYKTYGGEGRREREKRELREKTAERRADSKDERDRREKSNERNRRRENETKLKQEESRRKERCDERDNRREGKNKDENERPVRIDAREKRYEISELERNDWLREVGRKSSRRERFNRMKETNNERSSSSLKRSNQDNMPHLRMRSHSLEDIPSTIERKKRQIHVIQRTKSWASRPTQRAESPSIPAQTIQLEFHPITGDVTPLDTKSEVSTEPNSLTVESSPLMDYEWPADRYSDSYSPSRDTKKTFNDNTNDFVREKSSLNHKKNMTLNSSKRSAGPINTADNRRSSTYSDSMSERLVPENKTNRQQTRSVDFTKTEETQERSFSKLNIVQNKADTFSKPKRARSEISTKPKATQTEVFSKPQETQTDTLSKREDSIKDLYTKAKENYPDFFSTSSYDSQSSTDDYRVYQNEVRKFKGRPRSTGSKAAAPSSFLEKRVQSDRVLDLKATNSEQQSKDMRTPTSSISSDDVDWHLYTIEGKKVLKPEVTRSHHKGLEWHSFTLSNKRQNRNMVTQTESRNEYTNGSFDGLDDDVFTEATTVKRNETRNQASFREKLQPQNFKNNGTSNTRNIQGLVLHKSSSQPVVYSFE